MAANTSLVDRLVNMGMQTEMAKLLADPANSTNLVNHADEHATMGGGTGAPVSITSGAFDNQSVVTDALAVIGVAHRFGGSRASKIVFGGAAATYVQSGTTVTVIQTAHGLTADYDGSTLHLKGDVNLADGWYSGFTYISADSFSVQSLVSQSASGSLAANTAEVTCFTDLVGAGDLGSSGVASVRLLATCKSSANQKTFRCRFSGWVFWAKPLTTVSIESAEPKFCNASSSSQISLSPQFTDGLGSTALALSAVKNSADTTIEQPVVIAIALANSADWAAIIAYDAYISK